MVSITSRSVPTFRPPPSIPPRKGGGKKKSEPVEAKNIGHGVIARLLVEAPEGRLDCAAGEDAPVLGAMRQLQALAGACENHRMLADHGAAAKRRKADVAGIARAGMPVAAAHGAVLKRNLAAFRRRL